MEKKVNIFTNAYGQARPTLTVSLTVKYPVFFTPSLRDEIRDKVEKRTYHINVSKN